MVIEMDLLTAHELLTELTQDERANLLDFDCEIQLPGGAADCWPAAAVAAAVCSQSLPQCDGLDGLRDAVRYFGLLLGSGHADVEEWKAATLDVVNAIAAAGYDHARRREPPVSVQA